MADSQMARLGDRLAWTEGGNAKWDYTAGLFTLSLLKLNERVNDPARLRFVTNAIGPFILAGIVEVQKLVDARQPSAPTTKWQLH